MDIATLPPDVRELVHTLRDAKVHLAATESAYFTRRERSWTKAETIQRLRRDYSMAMLDYASARMAVCEALDELKVPMRWLAEVG